MVVPTRRLLLLAIAGVVPILFFGTVEVAPLAGGLWLAAMAILAWIDSRFTPQSNALSWERLHEGKLSLGAWNTVTLRLKNKALQPVRLRVRDSVPQLLLARGEVADGECRAGGTWSTSYAVFPVHRGDYSFGPVTARY